MKRSQILRILDANFNRSREGLRVCEEITRFVMEDQPLTEALKKIRHAVSDSLKKLPASAFELADSRNVRDDVGKKPSALERKRNDAAGIFLANAERVKESLRVLEETSKLLDRRTSENLKKIRFRTYTVEKKILKKLDAIRHHGS